MGLDQAFFIKDEDTIIGAVIVSQLISHSSQWFLHALVIEKKYRNKGLARKLLSFVEAYFTQLKSRVYEDELPHEYLPITIICFASESLSSLYQKQQYKMLKSTEYDVGLSTHLYKRFITYQNKNNTLRVFSKHLA